MEIDGLFFRWGAGKMAYPGEVRMAAKTFQTPQSSKVLQTSLPQASPMRTICFPKDQMFTHTNIKINWDPVEFIKS